MSKIPAFQFYPADWLKDPAVQAASAATRGVWINLLCRMWESAERGRLRGTHDQLRKLAGCEKEEWEQCLQEIKQLKIADVHEMSAEVVIENRRMLRDQTKRDHWRIQKQQQREESQSAPCPQPVQHVSTDCPPVSSSSSSSSRQNTHAQTKTFVHENAFERFWKAYPKKRSKGQAEKAWKAIHPNEQLVATMVATIERAKTSEEWRKDSGQFIPYPATWLRARGWEDEIKSASVQRSVDPPPLLPPMSSEERAKSWEQGKRLVKALADELAWGRKEAVDAHE